MKKSNILIAVFAVIIAAASAARAERMAVDFDGNASGAGSFMEAVKSAAVSLDVPPVPKTFTWALPDSGCLLMCAGPQYLTDDCRCKPLPGYEDFYNFTSTDAWWSQIIEEAPPLGMAANSAAAKKSLHPARSWDQTSIRRLAGYYTVQKDLRNILLAYFNMHDNFSSGIFQVLQDKKTMIIYDNKGVYLANGKTLYGTNDKELVKKVMASKGLQTKGMGWDDFVVAAVLGCVFSDDCREDVVNYVSNLHDDEHDTYHNNHDGSNPNYEVNKKVN